MPKSPTKCSNFRRYKGLRPPRCGCDMCILKFEMKQENIRLQKRLDEAIKDLKGRIDNDWL